MIRCRLLRGCQERGRVCRNLFESRGGLRRQAPGEATPALPIPEHLPASEGGISQPFRRGHQARGGFAPKGGVGGGSHRGRPYGPRARKRHPGHLRLHIRGGAYRRQEMGPDLRRPSVQHPRGPTTLPRPKRGRVSGSRANVEGGKLNPPAPWPLDQLSCLPSYSPNHVDRLSEKGFEQRSERGFGQYKEGEMGGEVPSRRSVGLRHRRIRGFSDGCSYDVGWVSLERMRW
jgi:hypothetical protein